MPTYGCFRMDIAKPERTWTADYIVSKGSQHQFWRRSSGGGEADVLIGVARLKEGQTICEVESTSMAEPSIYRAVFDGKEPQKIHEY